MIEHRAQERIKVNQLAMFSVAGIRGIYPCSIENLSNEGATLTCSTAHIAAFEFDLSLDGFRTTRHCHVVWRRGNACGVEFVERPPHSMAH
jgi:hypothetical protein